MTDAWLFNKLLFSELFVRIVNHHFSLYQIVVDSFLTYKQNIFLGEPPEVYKKDINTDYEDVFTRL